MIKNLALHEMVSRILKDQINLSSRAAMQANKIPNDEVYRQLILGFFNNIFVFDRHTFWGHVCAQLPRPSDCTTSPLPSSLVCATRSSLLAMSHS